MKPWQIKRIRETYEQGWQRGDGTPQRLAQELGVRVGTIMCWVSRNGLGERRREMTPEVGAKIVRAGSRGRANSQAHKAAERQRAAAEQAAIGMRNEWLQRTWGRPT